MASTNPLIFSTLNHPFIIAEAGINHNGELELAFQMIQIAKDAGADAIKFQTFKAEEFCGDPTQLFTYTSQGKEVTEPMVEMFKRVEFSEENWNLIAKRAQDIGIEFLSTPQNNSDLDVLLRIGVRAIKVGSDDLVNEPLISSFSKTGLPMILSSGMSDESEIDAALNSAGFREGHQVALLVCTSQYPTPSSDVNISRLDTLRAKYPHLTLGFSDHTEGNEAAILAVAKGALIFEKHFTLDHNLPGPDHWFSPDPAELKLWVQAIRRARVMLGTGVLSPSDAELDMRVLARRSPTVIKEIQEGEIFSDKNIGQRRPGNGMAPKEISRVLGKRALKSYLPGYQLKPEDFEY